MTKTTFVLLNLGITANSAVFVGDSTVDQNAAIAANIPFIFFSEGYNDGVDVTKTFLIVNDLSKLIEVFNP
jgi:phosphoglycolate phosphatase-like HAD superfamily hydrolase